MATDAQRVRSARAQLRESQAKFGDRFHVSPVAISRWESGQRRLRRPAQATLAQIEADLAVASSIPPKTTTSVPPIGDHTPAAIRAKAEADRETAWMSRKVSEAAREMNELREQRLAAAARAEEYRVEEAETRKRIQADRAELARLRKARAKEIALIEGMTADKPERERTIDLR